MKALSWVLTALLFSATALADDEKHGAVIDRFPDGKKSEVTHYEHGTKEGRHEEYWENGRLREESTFRKGRLEGELKNYFEDGQVSQVAEFREGKRNGKTVEYQQNGKRLREFSYRNGALHGVAKNYDARGELSSEETYQGGKRAGESISYAGGRVRQRSFYENDRLVRRQSFDETGKAGPEDEILPDGSVKVRK